MKKGLFLLIVIASLLIGGCGEPQGENLEKVGPQPEANLDAGAKAQSIEEWSKANPGNGAPGH